MSSTSWLLLGISLAVAILDWVAVSVGNGAAERILKPATMIAIIGLALSLDFAPQAALVPALAALGLSLAGDVFLLRTDGVGTENSAVSGSALPGRDPDADSDSDSDSDQGWFVAGLAAFLLAHIAYVVSMSIIGVDLGRLALGVILVAPAAGLVGRRVLIGARRTDVAMFVPVLCYLVVISAMAVTSIGTGRPWLIVGALLFVTSDSLLGWNRFVAPVPLRNLLVMSTYHLAQVFLVLGHQG